MCDNDPNMVFVATIADYLLKFLCLWSIAAMIFLIFKFLRHVLQMYHNKKERLAVKHEALQMSPSSIK